MISAEKNSTKFKPDPNRPTSYLIRDDINSLSDMNVYLVLRKGFEVKDVQTMLEVSKLYSNPKIMSRIYGKSVRSIQRQLKANFKNSERLTPQQSTTALHYAKALEKAIEVFGNQKRAEEWLDKPCKYLNDEIPLNLIENPIGYKLVEDYLKRVELGVYL